MKSSETTYPRALTRRRFLHTSAAAAWAGGLVSAPAQESSREVKWLDEIQTAPAQAEALQKLPRIEDASGEPIKNLDTWKTRRREIAQWWLDFLGPLPQARETTPSLQIIEEDRVGEVIRQRVRYEIEPGLLTEAYLLKPAESAAEVKLPGVVVFHSTVDHSIRQPAGVEGKLEKAFGLQLAQRGFVCFCPRHFLWQDNQHFAAQEQVARFHRRHPRSKGMAKALYDGVVAVNILAAQPEVDSDRLGSIGHSLGAKEVLYLAAFDERIKVTVGSEGGIGTDFSNWDAPWYLGETIKNPNFGHEHHELLALAAPRAFLLLGGDSADGDRSWPFIEAARPIYDLYPGRPRLGLYNHKKGHTVPPDAESRIYDWFERYL